MKHFEGTLCGYFVYYQTVYGFFIRIIHEIRKANYEFDCDCLEETTEFLNQMIVQKSK